MHEDDLKLQTIEDQLSNIQPSVLIIAFVVYCCQALVRFGVVATEHVLHKKRRSSGKKVILIDANDIEMADRSDS